MFFHLQFPFTDLRGFVSTVPRRLAVPSWPAPLVDEEFVRSFGSVRMRRLGGLTGWIGESAYCDTRRAVAFPQTRRPVFGRLYFDGLAVGKFEFGLQHVYTDIGVRPIESEIFGLLSSLIGVREPGGGFSKHPLHRIGSALIRLYGYSTSEVLHKPGFEEPVGMLRSEAPMVVIELSEQEAQQFPWPRFAVELKLDPLSGLRLAFWAAAVTGRTITFWCLVAPRHHVSARHLRIFLMRLNAEHQAFKRVLQAVGKGIIDPIQRGDLSQRLQSYLNVASRRILRFQDKASEYCDQIETLAISAFDNASAGENAALIERLRLLEVRGNIIRKIQSYTNHPQITINVKELNMSTDNKTTHSTTTIIGSTNVNINSTLTQVQQVVGSMPVGTDDDKQALQTLLQQLAEELKKAPESQAKATETVMKRASQLVDEGASEAPDSSLLTSLGSALKKSADFVKTAVPAVATIAGQIVSLIGNLHGLSI